MCRSPWENVVYELSSDQHVLFVLLGWFVKWEYVAVELLFCKLMLPGYVQKCYVQFLSSFRLSFSPCVSFESRWPIHSVVPTQLLLGKKPRLILSERSDFHLIENLLITFLAFPIHMLRSFSVDDILLPTYMNWSTNFKSLWLKVNMVPFFVENSV